MARQIRRVTRRTYDRYQGSDYPLGNDNLNPMRNTELEGQVHLILNEVHNRIVKAYSNAGIAYNDSYNVDNPDIEGMGNDIDYLIRALSKNPLVDLADQGFNIKPLIGSGNLETLANPICINCLGIPSVEKVKDQNAGVDAKTAKALADALGSATGAGGGGNGATPVTGEENVSTTSDPETDNKPYTIKYVQPSNVNVSAYTLAIREYPTTYTMDSCPIDLPPLTCAMDGYKFYGWYLDQNFGIKIANNKFQGTNANVTLYAKIDLLEDDEEDDEDTNDNDYSKNPEDEEKSCDVKELEFLKVILIICKIIMILVKIVGTVLGIVIPLIQIVKEAQLAWINPPLMASIIQRVAQKLMALVFSIIGILLMKLWSLLNFDCISEQAIETLNEINQTLAGINSTLGSIDAIAMEVSGVVGMDWKQLAKDAKDNIVNQAKKVGEQWKNLPDQIGNTFESIGQDWKEKLTDPQFLYSNAVPPEIRDQIETIVTDTMNVVDTANTSMETIQSMINTFSGKKADQKAVGRRKEIQQ